MELRQWIQEKVGADDTETLLDASVYSEQDLREDKLRVRRERQRLKKQLEEYRTEYKRLIEVGGEASEVERQSLAQKAKVVKNKHQITEKKYRKNGAVLSTLVTIEAIRELQNQRDEHTTAFDSVMADSENNIETLRTTFQRQMEEYNLDAQTMQAVQRELDIDALPSESTLSPTNETDIMEQMASQPTTDIGTLDVGERLQDVDTDHPEPTLGSDDESDVPLPTDDSTSAVTVNVNWTTDSRPEIDIVLDDDHTVRVRTYQDTVATTWDTSASLSAFVEIVTDSLGVTDSARTEARLEADDGEILHESGTLNALDDIEWYPENCRLLAIDGPSYEVRWEDDPGQAGTFAVTITADTTVEDLPTSTLLRETLRDEVATDGLEQLMGQTQFVLEEYTEL